MPMLLVQTNLSIDKLPSTINTDLTQHVSDLLNKPKNYIFVSVQHVPNLTFQGTNEPTALIELKSIGFASRSKVVAGITSYLDSIGIPSARVGMTLVDLKPEMVGIGGTLYG